MAANYRTDIFLKKLYYIHEQCASARKKKDEEDAEANMDDFTRLRKKIAQDIRETKEVRSYATGTLLCFLFYTILWPLVHIADLEGPKRNFFPTA